MKTFRIARPYYFPAFLFIGVTWFAFNSTELNAQSHAPKKGHTLVPNEEKPSAPIDIVEELQKLEKAFKKSGVKIEQIEKTHLERWEKEGFDPEKVYDRLRELGESISEAKMTAHANDALTKEELKAFAEIDAITKKIVAVKFDEMKRIEYYTDEKDLIKSVVPPLGPSLPPGKHLAAAAYLEKQGFCVFCNAQEFTRRNPKK